MKTAVVTGASGDIGVEIANAFIQAGYFVVAQYNDNKSGIDSLIERLKADGREDYLFPVNADFSTLDGYKQVAEVVKNSFKHIDAIINCAGMDLIKEFTDTTQDDLNKIMNVNFNSAYMLTSELSKLMIANKNGKIIFISSIWGSVGGSMETAYSASKSALHSLTKALAKELAPSNINVNCVCPGVIDTKMNAKFSASERAELINQTPLGRFGTPSEVADLVYFLCSDKAEFITGQVITLDGGFTL